MRLATAGVVWLLTPVTVGCYGGSDGWPDVVSTFASGGATYSMSFFAQPPAGSFLDIAAVSGASSEVSCNFFRYRSISDEFWYLRVEISAATIGVFDIVSSLSLPSMAPVATVRAVHVVDSRPQRTIAARAGNVVVLTGSFDTAEWPGAARLGGSIAAIFAKTPWRTEVCTGIQGGDDPRPTLSCTCLGPDDSRTNCVPTDGVDDCCSRIGDEEVMLTATIDALPCPWMCRFASPELARACFDLGAQ
jgi:hypothetical protein